MVFNLLKEIANGWLPHDEKNIGNRIWGVIDPKSYVTYQTARLRIMTGRDGYSGRDGDKGLLLSRMLPPKKGRKISSPNNHLSQISAATSQLPQHYSWLSAQETLENLEKLLHSALMLE